MPHIPVADHATLLATRVHTNGAAAQLREWSSVIGIVTAIVGNILISFALNIQRYAHIRLGDEQEASNGAGPDQAQKGLRRYGTQNKIAEERLKANLDGHDHDGEPRKHGDEDALSLHSQSSHGSTLKPADESDKPQERKSYLRSPYWWVGIVLMVIGEAGNFLAYGFAPASIVSPLGVVALVSNCIIAPFLLKERFRQRDLWGVMVAIAGAVVVVLSAKNSETKMGPSDLWQAIKRWEFLLYLGITALAILVLAWASGKYGEKTILVDLGLVGLFGGYTALSTKGVASLLSYTLWRALTFPITYLLVVVLVVSALAQIRYVNRALQRFDSTQVIPTQFVLFTISVIVGSAVLYRDFESATAGRVGKFIGGCVLTFIGVYLITSARTGEDDDKHDGAEDGEEERIALVDEELEYNGVHADDPSESATPIHKPNRTPAASKQASRRQSQMSETRPRTPLRQMSRTSSSALLSETEDYRGTRANTPRPRPLENTISTPLLPTSSSQLDESSSRPDVRQRRSDRPSALSRQSMARLMPGPLSSPLSSPLNAIVADSLRRGTTVTPTRARNAVSSARMSRSRQSTGDLEGGESGLGPSPLKAANAEEGAPASLTNPGQSTPRRLSIALGDFFHLNRERSQRSNTSNHHEPE